KLKGNKETIMRDVSKYIYDGYATDKTKAIDNYLKEEDIAENLLEYYQKNKDSFRSYVASTLLSSELLPSEDPEINNDVISLSQEKRKREITKKALDNPEQFINDYEEEYDRIINDIDNLYSSRIQYYVTLGYNKKQAKEMAKNFIKSYKEERIKMLETYYPTSTYNKCLNLLSQNKIIIKEKK